MRNISRRGFIADERRRARRAAVGPIDRRARTSHQSGVPSRRRQRRSAERSRHPVDARHAERRDRRRPCRGSWRAIEKFARSRLARRAANRRGARLHGQGRCARPRAGHDLLLPLRVERRAVGDRPHQDAAGRQCQPRPPRRGVVLEPAAGILQRLRVPCQARRPRRDAAPRRLLLRISPTSSTATARALGRIPAPDKEIVALHDYRERHAQYKADPDSQEIHRQHPFIVTWDDHEFANNTWWGGARESQRRHGRRLVGPARGRGAGVLRVDADSRRRADADAAHLSHVPLRRPRDAVHARHPAGRPRSGGRRAKISRRSRRRRDQLLGAAQENWLAGEFVDVGAQPDDAGMCSASRSCSRRRRRRACARSNADSWDGYRAARDRVFDMVERTKVRQPRRADRRHPQLVGLRSAAPARSMATTRPPARDRSASNSPARR